MDATHQLSWIPDSFTELYRGQGGRLMVLVEELRARYELCEDLAQHLTTHCQSVHVEIGAEASEVLGRCLQGLLTPESGVSEAEATWVVTRLAELLNWPHPGLPGGDS